MPYKDPAAKRANQQARFQGRRNDFIASQGGVCSSVDCESTDRLEVDHLDPSLKTMDPREIWKLKPADPRAIKELTNCRVLCHTCHIARSAQQTSERAKARRSGVEEFGRPRQAHNLEIASKRFKSRHRHEDIDAVSEETCVT